MPLRVRACARYVPPLHTCTAHILHVLHVLHVFSARPIILSHLTARNQAGNRTGMYHMYHLMIKKSSSEWACCGFRVVRFPVFGFFPSAQ